MTVAVAVSPGGTAVRTYRSAVSARRGAVSARSGAVTANRGAVTVAGPVATGPFLLGSFGPSRIVGHSGPDSLGVVVIVEDDRRFWRLDVDRRDLLIERQEEGSQLIGGIIAETGGVDRRQTGRLLKGQVAEAEHIVDRRDLGCTGAGKDRRRDRSEIMKTPASTVILGLVVRGRRILVSDQIGSISLAEFVGLRLLGEILVWANGRAEEQFRSGRGDVIDPR